MCRVGIAGAGTGAAAGIAGRRATGHAAVAGTSAGPGATMHIRHSGPGDIDAVRAIYAQPSNYASTLQLPHPSRAIWEKRLGGTDEHFHSLVACEDEEVLGQIGIATHARARP